MSDFSKLKDYIESLNDRYPLASSDVIVMKEHERLFRCMSGFRHPERGIPLDGSELYYIYSCTKMCTCVAAMQLIEKGKLSLSDKLADYIPEFSDMSVKCGDGTVIKSKNPITIRNLMTMTGGFGYDIDNKIITDAIKKNPEISTLELVRKMSKMTLHFQPGTRYEYSLCHDILAAVVEVVSGMKFSEYLNVNIFEPLGMTRTGFTLKESDKNDLASAAFVNEDGSFTDLHDGCCFMLSKNYESGGAGLISSTEDYIKLPDALANDGVGKTGNRILTRESIDRLRKDELSDELKIGFTKGPEYSYGLGFRTLVTKKYGAKSPLGEFGWDGARGCYYLIDPENHIAIYYSTQIASEHGFIYSEVHPTIRNLVYEALEK
ncbi:MAG: serine hydrolase [Clostridiales bacterium]|nr:serine hydrolase [Clostridiales bacterium]